MVLKFRRLGWFADEDSARYQAKINNNLFVSLSKCAYSKEWRCNVTTADGYTLEYQTADLNASIHYWSKKEAIRWLQNAFDDTDYVNNLTKQSIDLDKRLKTWN